MKRVLRRFAPWLGAASLSLAMAAPVAAQPVITGGLVNVTIVNFADVNLEDITVQIPVSAAANVCDVNAAVLLAAIEDTGSAECTATSASRARR
jgi:hypothetical protein